MPGGVYLDLNDAFGKTDQFDFTIQLAQFRPSGIKCFHHSTVKLLRMERMQKKQMPNDRVFPSFQNDRFARRSTIEDDLHHSLKRGAVNVQKKLDNSRAAAFLSPGSASSPATSSPRRRIFSRNASVPATS